MPYSFSLNGLKNHDYIATLAFPIALFLGTFTVEYSLSFC